MQWRRDVLYMGDYGKDKMKGHVNSSGFPLQIAVMNCVDDSYDAHGWRTLYAEHSWRNSNNEETGFIDLVLAHSGGGGGGGAGGGGGGGRRGGAGGGRGS